MATYQPMAIHKQTKDNAIDYDYNEKKKEKQRKNPTSFFELSLCFVFDFQVGNLPPRDTDQMGPCLLCQRINNP